MLRQIHIFHKGKKIFTHNYAIGFNNEELNNVIKIIQGFISAPMPGKTIHRPISNFQIFHRGFGLNYFLFVADLVDSIDYIENILKKTITKFKELFSDPLTIQKPTAKKSEFLNYLKEIQKELHSKIAIIGPVKSGKTTLYNLLKYSSNEKMMMNFAKSAPFMIDDLFFDIWDFQLKDNFSLLWSKFVGGSDLIILLFDASNYNLKIIDHFVNLHKRDAHLSKLVIIANKRDLVSDEDIKRIINELNISEIKEISLKDPKVKSQLYKIIRNALKLKRPLPPEFSILLKEAERLDNKNQISTAITKYKQLIHMCNEYQDYSFIETFNEKIKILEKRKEIQIQKQKELERKKKFSAPDKIKFTKKISVKSLPSLNSSKIKNTQNDSIKTTSTPSKIKSLNQEKKTEIHNIQKRNLKLEDVKIKLSESKKSEKNNLRGENIIPNNFEPYEKNLTDLIMTNEGFNFVETLQRLIKEQGGDLSKNLCNMYISELLETLNRPLTFEDLKIAAKSFIKKEMGD
ncbi:MAG: GTPase domain-containing protein [Promethearchaeota archaeon]